MERNPVLMGFFLFYINNEVMSTVSYYTAEGLKKLREELDYLKNVMRPKASQDIADARDKGDLSENAEYDAAKEAQGMLEMRIAKLEEIHSNARLIDETHLDVSKVLVLSKVKIKNQTNGMEVIYTLVAESEADLKTGKISVTSPIGKGLLGKSVGDIANSAMNSTFGRTINTSMTIFLVLLAIFIFGGESIRGFAFALLIGIVVGTYSSLFIATPVYVDMAKKDKDAKND